MDKVTGLTGRALGEAVIEHVLTYPETHDQSLEMNECGTVGCIAGWVNFFAYGINSEYEQEKLETLAGTWSGTKAAAAALGVSCAKFGEAVYDEIDRDTAIANFKHLLDETYSERVA
jgi:hypothetical protein